MMRGENLELLVSTGIIQGKTLDGHGTSDRCTVNIKLMIANTREQDT